MPGVGQQFCFLQRRACIALIKYSHLTPVQVYGQRSYGGFFNSGYFFQFPFAINICPRCAYYKEEGVYSQPCVWEVKIPHTEALAPEISHFKTLQLGFTSEMKTEGKVHQ